MVHVINGSCVKSSIVRLPAGLKVGLAAHFVTTFGQQKNYQIMERGIGRFPPLLSLLNQAWHNNLHTKMKKVPYCFSPATLVQDFYWKPSLYYPPVIPTTDKGDKIVIENIFGILMRQRPFVLIQSKNVSVTIGIMDRPFCNENCFDRMILHSLPKQTKVDSFLVEI